MLNEVQYAVVPGAFLRYARREEATHVSPVTRMGDPNHGDGTQSGGIYRPKAHPAWSEMLVLTKGERPCFQPENLNQMANCFRS